MYKLLSEAKLSDKIVDKDGNRNEVNDNGDLAIPLGMGMKESIENDDLPSGSLAKGFPRLQM